MSSTTPPHPAEKRLHELWTEFVDLHAAEALLHWDQETKMPAGGNGPRGEILATLAALKHRCLVSSELHDVIEQCAENAASGSPLAAQVRAARHAVDRAVKVPERLNRALAEARTVSLDTWQRARRESDFSLYEESLRQMVALKREEAAAIATGGSLYDTMIDGYEPGARSSQLAVLFAELTEALAPLVRAVAETGFTVDESPVLGSYPGDLQAALGRRAAAAIGFDFDAGRLDKSVHPFCIRVHRGDVRMTCRYREDDFRPGLFGILHESGHCLYEQGMPEAWHRTPVDDSSSLGVHESQSLLWENHVGRSRGFLRWFVPVLREIFPEAPSIDADRLWPMLHTVRPSLIRVDADETTYNLHIAVRFEIERALFGEGDVDLEVAELPEAWNERYERYLGIRPANDAEGVLQDIHWAHGSFGYFPTYTLGMLGAAQLFAAARRDLGNLDEAFAAGQFRPLLDWLRERVHRHGRLLSPGEIFESATGRPLEVTDFLAGLRRDAEAVYGVGTDL